MNAPRAGALHHVELWVPDINRQRTVGMASLTFC